MFFGSISEEERKCFLRQNYGAHLPGYTGHCPTLKFRVGKRFGACTQEIMKELLEKKILKAGPYRPNTENEVGNTTFVWQKDDKPAWKSETHLFKAAPPYILGYTGYIPGFNNRYGLSFMRAVEEGAKEWRESQSKLRARRDTARHNAGKNASKHILPRIGADNMLATEISHSRNKNQQSSFYYEVSPERPPIVGYTGHIPGAKGEVSLSKRYAQAAKKGLELIRSEREKRLGKFRDVDAVQRALNVTNYDETRLVQA